MTARSSKPNYCFGAYEADPRTGELRKSGIRIRIAEQPFRILAALLENPGELVTRDHLRQVLWPDDTFVDFDHSLNAAVNKLREVLGDSANHPRFVETIPRRGYRFIYPVEGIVASEGGQERVENGQTGTGALSKDPDGHTFTPKTMWVVGLAGVATLIAVWAVLPDQPSRTAETAPLRAVPLTSGLGTEGDPSFSPDGTQVVYSATGPEQDNYDIYVKRIDSENPMQLTFDSAAEYEPAWSPDGRWIAFLRDQEGTPAIYLISPLGSDEHKLADVSPSRGGIAWWPDSKSLVISHFESPGDPFALYRVFIDTRSKQRLTSPPAESVGDNQPAFDPDGQTLAFTRWASSGESMIYLTDLSGLNAHVLTSAKSVEGIAWTPDGREIVFSEGPFPELFRIPVSGGRRVALNGAGVGSWNPEISASARRLVFEKTNFDPDIWRYDLTRLADSPASPQRFIASTHVEIDAQFSPTGDRIAFGSDRSGESQIWVCDAALPDLNCFRPCEMRGAWAGSPRWSPDGKRVAFDFYTGSETSIVAVDVETRAHRILAVSAGENSRPSWSHDSKWVYFGSNRSGSFQVWKAPADAPSGARQVTSQGGYNPFASSDGRFLYYVKGHFSKYSGQTEVWRMELRTRDESHVFTLPRGMEGAWDLVDDGVFFLDQNQEQFPPPWVVKFFNFATGRVESKWVLNIPPTSQSTPFDISPDRKWLIYSSTNANTVPPYKRGTADLMLVEDFQ